MNKEKITSWLQDFSVINYIINDDLTVDVDGNVNIASKGINGLPFKLFI
jgi:hypothetical protein